MPYLKPLLRKSIYSTNASQKWNVINHEIPIIVTVLIPAAGRVFVATVCTITGKWVNYLPVISLMILKRAMIEALKASSHSIRKEVPGFNRTVHLHIVIQPCPVGLTFKTGSDVENFLFI